MAIISKKPAAADRFEDDIPEEMLDKIPDIHPVATLDPRVREVSAEESSPALHALLAQMQREMDVMIAAEFARIESSMTGAFVDVEARLAQSEAELADLREKNAELLHAKDRYDRAIQAIKELTEGVDLESG